MITAMLAGASGLVGSLALEELINDVEVEKIVVVTRSSLQKKNNKLIEIVLDFEKLPSLNLKEFGVDHVDVALCSLGTTIKKAKTKDAFYKVDFTYVQNFAELAKRFGSQSFGVVSALGANKSSSIFYNQVKGEMEEGLSKIAFQNLIILRPSLLIGDRNEKRVGEKLLITMSPAINTILVGPLKKYRGICAEVVAKALVSKTLNTKAGGVYIVENDKLITD